MRISKLFIRENLTIPNILSLIRILLIPVVLLILIYAEQHWLHVFAIVLAIFAMTTDFFDGYLARKLNQQTDLGKILDPIADKMVIAAAAVYLFITADFPLWLILAILIRDVLILIGGSILIEKNDIVLDPNIYGKWTTGVLFLLFIVYIFSWDQAKSVLEIGAALLIVLSFYHYFKSFLKSYSNKKSH